MGETKRYYENGQWHEYESVWDGRELLPGYDSPSVTAWTIEQLQAIKDAKERRAPRDSYRIVGRLRRRRKENEG